MNMTIAVRLFGELKEKAPKRDASGTIGLLELNHEVGTIGDIIRTLGLEEKDVSHLFLNGDYSGPGRKVEDGDTVSIFPRSMALLYKWYFSGRE